MPKSAGHAQWDDRHGGIAMNPRTHDGHVDAGRGQASPIRANAEGIGLSILSPRALGKGPLTRGEGVGPRVGGADFCGCLEGSLEKRSMAEGAKGARAKLGACAAGDPNKPVGWRLSLWLLSIASVCAVSSIVGYDTGWAHFHKDHYKPKTNTYLALVLTIMGDYPDVAEKIPANLVDIVKPLLPAVNISIDIQLGWLERTTILDLHSDELSPVITNFLEKPELDPYRDQIDQVAVDRRMVMRNFYKDTGVEAQWSGAISAALLAVSILLSVSLFAAYAFTRASKGPRSVQCGRYCFMVMKLSTLLGPLLVASVIAHYVALGYGTHKRTEENIIFEEGFISWPSWACVAALLSGTMWTISGILVAKGSLPNPSTLARRSGGRTARDRGRA